MKKTWMKCSALFLAVAFAVPATLLAQNDGKDKEVKEKEKKDVRQIIVTTKSDKAEKMVIEVVGDKITINGKPYEEYAEKKDGEVSVRISKLKDMDALTFNRTKGGTWSYNGDYNINNLFATSDSNRAMLGVTTEKDEEGVKINDITKGGGAEKAGLKEGDVIKKIDEAVIDDPDDLSKTIRSHKPGDKVSVTYVRDKKEQKVTAELGKYKGMSFGAVSPGFDLNLKEMEGLRAMPRVQTFPKTTYGQNWSWSGGSPKLGLSVQDSDDGKGVKVIEVDEESNAAKAGVKENDVITEVDGKAVNSTDDMVKMIKDSKEKNAISIKLQRSGKTQTIEVKMPKRIKTADL